MGVREQIRKLILRTEVQGGAKARADVKNLQSDVGQLTGEWQKMTRMVSGGLAAIGVGVGAAAAVAGVKQISGAFVQAGREVENYRLRLETVMRDTQQAAGLFDYLLDFGARTPFELPGLIEASTRLQTFGLDTTQVLETLGDAAAANAKDIETAALAITQGMLGEMEMMKQFAITGADVQKRLGHAIDRSTVEGQREVADAILAIFRDRYAGGMEKASQTLSGIQSNMADNLFRFKLKVNDAGAFDAFKEDMQEVLAFENKLFKSGAVDAWAQGFSNAFQTINDTFVKPYLNSLNAMEIDTTTMAATTELRILKMAETMAFVTEGTARSLLQIQFLTEAPGELFKAMLSGNFDDIQGKWDDTWQAVLGHDKDVAIQERIDEINKGLDLLKQNKGVMTPDIEAILFPYGNIGDKVAETLKPSDAATKDLEQWWLNFSESVAKSTDTILKADAQPFSQADAYRAQGEELLAWYADFHGELIDMDIQEKELKMSNAIDFTAFTISNNELAVQSAQRMYSRMGAMVQEYTLRGVSGGRALNALMVRGAAETAKAGIDALIRVDKIKAASYLADGFAQLGMGNFAGAATLFKAAAMKGAIVGMGELGKALIEREALEREQKIAGPGSDMGGTSGGTTGGGRFKGTASSTRVGSQTNNFYVSITKNAARDIIEGDTGLTDAQELQRLFDEGAVQIPR